MPRFDMGVAITKAILEEVGTDFVLIDGSRHFTGNPLIKKVDPEILFEDIGSSPDYGRIIWDEDDWEFHFKDNADDFIGVRANWIIVDADITALKFFMKGGIWGDTEDCFMITEAVANSKIDFMTRYGGEQVCASLKCLGSNNGVFEILRGGDITMLAGKTLTTPNILMTGDFDLAGNDLLTTNLAFYEVTSNSFQIANRAKTLAKNLNLASINVIALDYNTSTGAFNARNAVNAYVLLRAPLTGTGLIEVARIAGGTAPEFEISRAGDIVSLAGKSLDAYTNAGYMKPRRLSQSAEPTPEVGEILLWRDTDNDETYLMYEDVDVGTRKVQLT